MVWVMAAALGYVAMAVYLFKPHWGQWGRWQVLWPINMVVGASGIYVLGRRWIVSLPASLIGGALYGFGPLALYLTRFHPIVGLVAAAIPWAFCPAVYVQSWAGSDVTPSKRSPLGQWLQWPLLACPFLAILVVLGLLGRYHLFLIPLNAGPWRVDDWIGAVAPALAVERGKMPIGVYHVPWAAVGIGLVMVIKARRWLILVVCAAGGVLACCPPMMGTSPVIWLCVVMAWCAVLVGLGLEGFVLAGWADRKWLLVGLGVLAGLCVATLAWAAGHEPVGDLAGDGLMIHTLKMYAMGGVAIALVLAVLQLKLRVPGLRQVAVFGAAGLDIVLSARLVADAVL